MDIQELHNLLYTIHTIRPLYWLSVELRYPPVLKILACKT